MMHQIALSRANVRVCECLVDFKRFGLNPFSVLVVETFLCDLADVYFRVEVCGKCLVVVACVAVYDVKIVYLVKVMFCRIGCIYSADTGIKSTAEYRR